MKSDKMTRHIVLGLDGACPDIVDAKIEEGKLPNFKRLRDTGCWADNLPFPSSVTPGNWTSIATGAKPWTHGISDFCAHRVGTPLDEMHQVFDKDANHAAEFIWDAYSDRGLKAATIHYPGALPQTRPNHVAIGAFGHPNENSEPWTIAPSRALVAGKLQPCGPYGWHEYETVELQPSDRAADLAGFATRYECSFQVNGVNQGYGGTHAFKLLLGLCRGQDMAVLLDGSRGIPLRKDTWSPWLEKDFTRDGAGLQRWQLQPLANGQIAGEFRFRLRELEVRSGRLLLYITGVYPKYDFATDPFLARDLRDRLGPYSDNLVISRLLMGWIDEDAFYDEFRLQGLWQARAAVELVRRHGFQSVFCKWHAFDKFYHFYMQKIDPAAPGYRPDEFAYYERLHDRVLEIADEMVGVVLDGLPRDTSLVVISDHGLMASRRSAWVNRFLAKHGYIQFTTDSQGHASVDWKRTRAFVSAYLLLYVNLKGRDPDGIVQPGAEYEQVKSEIIDLLGGWVDPQTGRRVMSEVFDPRKDGAFYGLGTELDGDVRYFTSPGTTLFRSIDPAGDDLVTDVTGPYLGDHGSCRPTTRFGRGGEIGLFGAAGKGFRRGVRRCHPILPSDVVPTLLAIAGQGPLRNQEGSVLYDLIADVTVSLN